MLENSAHFSASASLFQLTDLAGGIVSVGNQTGEGWILAGEMAEMAEQGVKKFIVVQPFGCLPNHVIGKGIIKKFRQVYPGTDVVAIDYDARVSAVNQLNRIRLMLAASE